MEEAERQLRRLSKPSQMEKLNTNKQRKRNMNQKMTRRENSNTEKQFNFIGSEKNKNINKLQGGNEGDEAA